MKCIVLAGGTGDRLWPLSRRDFPKQFVPLKNNHSLFQEAIARNLAFCDEFWIVTADQYRHIVEGQLQDFRELKFRCFCEEEGRRTAPALVLACLCAPESESFLVVSTDHVIEGEGYKEAIQEGTALLKQGRLVCLGVRPRSGAEGYGFLRQNEDGVAYRTPHGGEEAYRLMQESWLWDTGLLMGRAGDFLHEMNRYCPELVERMAHCLRSLDRSGRYVTVPAAAMAQVPAVSLGDALTARSGRMTLLEGSFDWQRVVNLESLREYYRQDVGHTIQEGCKDVALLNFAPGQLIAATGLEGVTVVNTADAVYLARADQTDQVRRLLAEHQEESAGHFDEADVYYTAWGVKQRLSAGPGYQVKKLTVFPGRSLTNHMHHRRSEQWSIVKGQAAIVLDGERRIYGVGESVLVRPGVAHQLTNPGAEDLVLIEVSLGELAPARQDGDLQEMPQSGGDREMAADPILRLEPVFKDNLWGGTALRDRYGKHCDYDVIAESWELSAHEAGQSLVASGPARGMPFGEYLTRIGRGRWGWKCQAQERFPLLIKLIDARKDLSIQVHPGDEYALAQENEYGKNEMWYIMDCQPGARLYCGFSQPVSKDEVAARVKDGTLTQVLNEVPVHKGQVVFIPAGMVHAIGAGILLCEVQQSSNVTYRLYDYGRKDRYGQLRQLHLDKALDVLDTTARPQILEAQENEEGRARLCACKYFSVERQRVCGKTALAGDDASFTALMFLEGRGTVQAEDTTLSWKSADCFFVPAGRRPILLEGEGTLLVVRL